MTSLDPIALGDTAPLWMPALTALAARLGATKAGRTIDTDLKARFRWLSDPEAKKAFFEAFNTGISRYSTEHADSSAARAVARVLTYIAEQGGGGLDQTVLLEQVFRQDTDRAALESVVHRYAWVLGSEVVPLDEIARSLTELIDDYLRPAFLATPYFTTRVGFVEIIGLLRDIRGQLSEPTVDLEGLEQDYRSMLAEKYEYITMQGISPRVQNRTIGIKMRDIFIPVEAVFDASLLYVSAHGSVEAIKAYLEHGETVEPSAESDLLLQYSSEHSSLSLTFLLSDAALPLSDAAADAMLSAADLATQLSSPAASKELLSRVLEAYGPSFGTQFTASPSEFMGVRRAVIQGHPGSGKSTLTRYVTWAAASGVSDVIGTATAERTPIRVRAIDFGEALDRGSVATLEEYLIEEAGRFAPIVKHALLAGRAVILVDGLDEVGKIDLRGRVAQRVDDFLADPLFDDSAVVVTTRIVGYQRDGLLGRLPHFTLSELTDEQIASFVEAWYRAIGASLPEAVDVAVERDRLLQAITRKPSIQRMARNPLLLTIIALIKWQGRALPDLRVLLYDVAAQTLIRSWPLTQRRVELDEFFIREWLAPVAHKIFADPTSDLIDEFSLMDELVASMQRLKPMTELEAKRASQELLESVSLHTGVLLPRGSDNDGRTLYGFLHQTFTEYFTAYYLAGKWEDGALDLIRYVRDPHWLEVILLTAGHLGIQRREKAGRFLRDLRSIGSSRYEGVVRQDLLLTVRVLADGVPVGPGNFVEELLSETLELWQATPFSPLRHAIADLLGQLGATEYGSAVVRLACRLDLRESEVLTLAQQLGPEHFVEELHAVLRKRYLGQKLLASRLLAGIGDAQGRAVLFRLAKTRGSIVRIQAAVALVDLGDPGGIEALVDALNDSESLDDLGSLSISSRKRARISQDPRVESALRGLLADEKLGSEAATVLVKADRLSVDDLRVLLRSPPSRLFRAALADTGPKADEKLVQLLGDQDPNVRLHAVELYTEHFGPESHGADGEAVALLLDDDVPTVRLKAAAWLASRGELRAREVLATLLNEDTVSLDAARALHAIEDMRGTDALRALLQSDSSKNRFEAAVELAKQQDSAALDVLVAALDDEDSAVRLSAARMLGLRRDLRAVQPLIDLLRTKRAPRSTEMVLEEWEDSRVTDALLKNLTGHERSPGRIMRVIALRADPRGIQHLQKLLVDSRVEVRLNAAQALLSHVDDKTRSIIEGNLDGILRDIQVRRDTRTLPTNREAVANAIYTFIQKYIIRSEQSHRQSG
jgi:HEAT repeat protein